MSKSNPVIDYIKTIGTFLATHHDAVNPNAKMIINTFFTLISEKFPVKYNINGSGFIGVKYCGFTLVLHTTNTGYMKWTTINTYGERTGNFKMPFIKIFKKLKMTDSQIEALLESVIFKYIG